MLHGALQPKNLPKTIFLVVLWGFVALGMLLAFYAYELPDIIAKTDLKRHPAIIMEARDGTVFARYGDFHGDTLAVANLPPHLVQAFIAVEDRRFYDHGGVDLWGVLRAAVTNIFAGHVVQGGSTLTQQLAKNLFLGPQRTMRRKIQEVLLALWLEHKYSKDEILSAYLNRIYLGSGTYGVDAAARLYFGKSARDVNVREACILAGLPRAPSRYSPLNNPAAAENRSRVVLQTMVDAGFILPSQKQQFVSAAPLPTRKPGHADEGRYFADWVMEQMGGLVDEQDEDVIIRTTLDHTMQQEAEKQLAGMINAHGAAAKAEQAALVTIGRDGAVRALVGGADYGESSFNRATQARRQPGSAFKPIVFMAALKRGKSPRDTLEDAPITINGWTPENYSGGYKGEVTLQDALAYSLNTATVRLAREVGLGPIRKLATQLGITSTLRRDLSLALGTSEVSLLELTGAYAVIAQDGRAIAPYGIESIKTKKGEVLYERNAGGMPRIVAQDVVDDIDKMLRAVVDYGTGKRAALSSTTAGKTGTTQDYRDAWFVGYSHYLTTGVWMGNDDNHPMDKITGGSLPAQLWHDYMASALHTTSDETPGAIDENAQETAYTHEQSSNFSRFLDGLFGGKVSVEKPDSPVKQ